MRAREEALQRADRFDFAALDALFAHPARRGPRPDDPLLVAVARRIERQGLSARPRSFRELLHTAWQRAPRLRHVERVDSLWALTASRWNRPLSDWQPSGRGRDALFRSLARHLLARWPVPAFLYGVFDLAPAPAGRMAPLLGMIGGGDSARAAVERGLLPRTMTRRMCHQFLRTPAQVPVIEAVRRAQVLGLGGDRALASRVCATGLGRELTGDEVFWSSFLQWLVNHPELPAEQIGPLFDYLEWRRGQQPGFSIAGRSAPALLRLMQTWHDELARERRLKGTVFEPSGFPAAAWRLRPRGTDALCQWTVDELLCSKQLRAEGRAMKHCVFAYADVVERGRTSIWSLRRDGERELTVEVDNRHKAIVQARSRLNRPPGYPAREVLARWADEAGLTLRRRLW